MGDTKSETAKRQGYVRNPPDKDKIGMPGYSYLDPKHWNVPQRRNQVCIPTKELSKRSYCFRTCWLFKWRTF